MARYIDADALIESIQETLCSKCDKYDGIKCKSCGIDDTIDFLDIAPTADVAPKSEVAKGIFWEVDKLLNSIVSFDEDDTEFIGVDVQKYYELKKKYDLYRDF